MVSSAENIHEQPLNATASEGGLKSLNPNDYLKYGLSVPYMYRYDPHIVYEFVKSGLDSVCKVPLSELVTCNILHNINPKIPKVFSKTVKMFFSEISEGEYQLEIKDVNIEGFPKTFKSRVYRIGPGARGKTYVEEYFNEYEVIAYPSPLT
eukprot:Nk52_evm1s1292 gene=Nk52_evmTU1s1292